MEKTRLTNWLPAILVFAAASAGRGDEFDTVPAPARPAAGSTKKPPGAPARPTEDRPPVWFETLARGTAEARKSERPIFLRAGGEDCRYCRAFEVELAKPEIQEELKRWTLVAIDVDESPGDARRMAVEAMPALRILTPAGKLVATREGFLPVADLADWLNEQFEAAAVPLNPELTEEGPPEAIAVTTLIREFKNRDAAIREAAVRRLLPYPEQAAAAVASAFSEGSLATRLAALELLEEWHAPVDGLDPWRPETLTAARLKSLADWGGSADRAAGLPARERLTHEESNNAAELLARMITAPPDESRAIRERLARYGRLLLPSVYERLRETTTDAAREQLTSLRYRLVAPESLALGWSGGLERLAAADPETRFRAAEELFHRATSADEQLLLELFSDPAPLVREMSLRALNSIVGTNAHSALIRLLEDPEPNVRAAVLNQLAESPSRTIVPRIAEYADTETDPDLVVHAIRVLREAKGETAAQTLMKLLSHTSWQVRAESAEGLGKFIERYGNKAEPLHAVIYTAMIDLLNDPDGFVLSRAVNVLDNADLIAAVEPLARAAEAHPELAREVIASLSRGQKQRPMAVVHLRRFSSHANSKLRAAAINALCEIDDDDLEMRLQTALQDAESEVRLAAANGLFELLNRHRPQAADATDAETAVRAAGDDEEPAPVGFLEGVIRALVGGGRGARPVPPPRAVPSESPEVEVVPDDGTVDGPVPADRPGISVKVDSGPTDVEIVVESDEEIESSNDSADGVAPDRIEAFLVEIRSGKTFGEKWGTLVVPLERMLASALPEERLAAALPLAALGHDQSAIPELLRLTLDERKFLSRSAEALPWLLSADRETLFSEMLTGASSTDEVHAIASQLTRIQTPRAGEDLWTLLGLNWIDATAAETLKASLLQFYFPNNYYQLQKAGKRTRGRAITAATPRAKSGPHWQRMVALALLLPFEPETVGEIARALVADPALDSAARVDAFQFLLVSESEDQGTQAAVSQLAGGSVELSDVALTYLTRGVDAINSLREGRFRVESSGRSIVHYSGRSSEQPIVPEPPPALSIEPLLPLLDSTTPRVVAQAGYLLALLERPDGLAALIDYWRTEAAEDTDWMKLVYRAIARLDDGTQLPVLKEVYARLSAPEHRTELSEFYWTVRSMTHADILPFRKQIRQDVGMDSLR